MSEYKLCYVDEPWVYFTTQDISKQWGDDWNDAPYDCNAGVPYAWKEGDNVQRYWIRKIAIDGDYETPSTYERNNNWSVELINQGRIPWLATDRFNRNKEVIKIFAGTTLADFNTLCKKAGWQIYVAM